MTTDDTSIEVSRAETMDDVDVDVATLIFSRLDNETLRKLSLTPLWSLIRKFASTNRFWQLRV